jgi:hypothetical protein
MEQRRLDNFLMEFLATAEMHGVPAERLRAHMEQAADELGRDVIAHVLSQTVFPPEMTEAQRQEVESLCRERFKSYFLSLVRSAHAQLVRANELRPS